MKNFILITLGIFFINIPLYAVDVSNFDIKGIKLGMSKSKVLRKMPCSNPSIDIWRTSNNKIYGGTIGCDNSNYRVQYDHNEYVYQISKRINFNIEPNLHKIRNKLIRKYGNPNEETKKKTMSKSSANGKIIAFCWGDYCKVKYENNGYWKGTEIENWTNKIQYYTLDKSLHNFTVSI